MLRYERVDVHPDEWAAAPIAPQSMAPHQGSAHVALPIGGHGMPPVADVAAPQQLPALPQQLMQHPAPHAPALPLGSALVADAYEYEVRPGVVWESARAIFSAHWSAYMALLLVGLLVTAVVAGALGFALVWAANGRAGSLDPQRPASSRGNIDGADAATSVSGDERVWLLIGGSLVVRLAAQWVFHVARCAALLVSLEHMRGRRQVLRNY